MKDFMDMMGKARELQTQMEEMQKELSAMEIEGTSGAGLVKVIVSGKGDMRSISIDPSLINPDEVGIVEDLIVAAFQDAKTRAEKAMQEKMQQMAGGMQLPPGMNPFG